VARRYLLDTNIVSELARRPQGKVANAIKRAGERSICTSIVVAAELRFGAAKSGSKRLALQVHRILDALEVLPIGEPTDRHYATIRQKLEQRGLPIGPNDLLIAAHALAEDCTLVTANEREFARVPSLKVENWLAPEETARS
jgi:tRNA(fMet)-specific endonuclease VapC